MGRFIEVQVTLQTGNIDSSPVLSNIRIQVANEEPDCSQAVADPEELWPPDHRFADVSVVGVTGADGDPIGITVTSIHQDEPVLGVGDGNTAPDGAAVGTSTASVRAERAGTPKLPGDGRVYRIGFTADDGQGGQCSGEATVCVRHDRRAGGGCVDGGTVFDSTATTDPACGLGFELVLLLPGIVRLFGRRGRLAA